MKRNIGVIVAAVFAVAVVFAGVRTFACDGASCKSANKTASVTAQGKACCPVTGATTASSGCPMSKSASETGSRGPCSSKMASGSCSAKSRMATTSGCAGKSSNAEMTSGGCSSHGAKAEMTSGGCSAHGANNAMTQSGCGSMMTAKAYYAANVFEVRDGHEYAVCHGKKFEVTAASPYSEVGNARYYFADEESKVKCSEKMKAMAAELDQETVSLATAEGNVTTDADGHRYAVCPVTNDKFLVTADSKAKVIDGQKYYVCSDKCASQLLHTADNPQSN